MEEDWKSVPGFDNYKVSSLGRVKNLKTNKMLNGSIGSSGYIKVTLRKDNIMFTRDIHSLVAMAFLKHKPNKHISVINHKDFNRTNNAVKNLEIITSRENTNKKHLESSSKFTGVSWNPSHNKWQSRIFFQGKDKLLGYFEKEEKAADAYKEFLNQITK